MARKPEQAWFQKAAEMMVRDGLDLRQVALQLELDLTGAEANNIMRTKTFQQVLWAERNRQYTEIAGSPGRTKESAKGLMYMLVQKLIDEGKFDKALEGILKLAKVEGWVGADSNVNIFAGLTAKDLENLKKDVKAIDDDSETGSASRVGETRLN